MPEEILYDDSDNKRFLEIYKSLEDNFTEKDQTAITQFIRYKKLGGFRDDNYIWILKIIDKVEEIFIEKKQPFPTELKYRKAMIYLLDTYGRNIKKAEELLLEIWNKEEKDIEWKHRAGFYLSMYIYLDEYYDNEYEIYKITKENIVKAQEIYDLVSKNEELSDMVFSFMGEFKNKLYSVTTSYTEFKVLDNNRKEISINKIDDAIPYIDKVDLYVDYLSENKSIFIKGVKINNTTLDNIKLLALIIKGSKKEIILTLFSKLENKNSVSKKISRLREYLRENLLLKDFKTLKLVVKNENNIKIYDDNIFIEYRRKFINIDTRISKFTFDNLNNSDIYIYIERLNNSALDKNLFSFLIKNLPNIDINILNLLEIDINKNQLISEFKWENLKKLDQISFSNLIRDLKQLNKKIINTNKQCWHEIFYYIHSEKPKQINLFSDLIFKDFIIYNNLSPFLENSKLDHLFPIVEKLNESEFINQFEISKNDFKKILNNIVSVIKDPIPDDEIRYKIHDYISTALSFKEDEIDFEF